MSKEKQRKREEIYRSAKEQLLKNLIENSKTDIGQIEEMATIIEITQQVYRDAFYSLPSPRNYAENLYTHSYRKQSVGEWLYERTPTAYVYYNCSACGWNFCSTTSKLDDCCMTGEEFRFCPNCGAKMKGGADGGGEQ